MAMLTVRNLPDDVHRALRVRAALHGRSTEAEVREILAELGVASLGDLVGQVGLLRRKADLSGAAATLALDKLLYAAGNFASKAFSEEPAAVSAPLDSRICEVVLPHLDNPSVRIERSFAIRNTDRSVGAGLAGEVARRFGDRGLNPGKLNLYFTGTAGQSFGAFNMGGM